MGFSAWINLLHAAVFYRAFLSSQLHSAGGTASRTFVATLLCNYKQYNVPIRNKQRETASNTYLIMNVRKIISVSFQALEIYDGRKPHDVIIQL